MSVLSVTFWSSIWLFTQLPGESVLHSFVFLYPSYFILSIHKQSSFMSTSDHSCIQCWQVLSCHTLYLLTLDHGACFSVPHTIFSHELIFAGTLPEGILQGPGRGGRPPPGRVNVCPDQVLRGTQTQVHSQPAVSRTFQRVQIKPRTHTGTVSGHQFTEEDVFNLYLDLRVCVFAGWVFLVHSSPEGYLPWELVVHMVVPCPAFPQHSLCP